MKRKYLVSIVDNGSSPMMYMVEAIDKKEALMKVLEKLIDYSMTAMYDNCIHFDYSVLPMDVVEEIQ